MINSHKLSVSESPDNFNMMSNESSCSWHVKAAGDHCSAWWERGCWWGWGRAGASCGPLATPQTHLLWLGPNQPSGSHWAKASPQCRWRQKEAKRVSRDGLVILFFLIAVALSAKRCWVMRALNPMGRARGFRSRKTLELVVSVWFNQMNVPDSSSYLWGLLSKPFFFPFFPGSFM